MKHRRINLGRLFYNNKFVLAFSVVASLLLWVGLAYTNTEEFPHAIENVPVTITLSDAAQTDGLKVFSPTDETARVYVKGNSLVVSQLQSSDLQVVAPLASTITSPGTYSFNLVAQKTGTLTDFEVSSVSPNQAIIVVDRYKEKTFSIESDITYKAGYQADSSYFVGTPVLSTDTVTISGPEKEVSQVNRVAFQYEVQDTLTDSKTFTTDLVMYDVNGNRITSNKLKMSETKVEVTIPVQSRKVVPLTPNFTNKPEGLLLAPEQIQINPQTVEIAGPQSIVTNLTDVSLAPLDFSSISPEKNSFDLSLNLPSGCKNLSNTPTAKITLNLGGFSTRSMVVNNFTVKNLSSDKRADIYTKNMTITVVGPESEISQLTENNLVAQIDMAGKGNFTGHTEMPVVIGISSASSSWVYGTYMANIGVSAK